MNLGHSSIDLRERKKRELCVYNSYSNHALDFTNGQAEQWDNPSRKKEKKKFAQKPSKVSFAPDQKDWQ